MSDIRTLSIAESDTGSSGPRQYRFCFSIRFFI